MLRDNTERPEAVDAGVAILVGTSSQRIVAVASHLLKDAESYRTMARQTSAFGEGTASHRIVEALLAQER